MPFIPEGFGQVTHIFNILGTSGPGMVTYGIEDNTLNTPDNVADNCQVAWTQGNSMHDTIDDQVELIETRVLLRRGGELVVGADFTQVAGGTSGLAAPPQVALLYQKQTGFAGRNRRGRMYVPAVPQPQQGGTYTDPELATFTNRGAAFLANLVSVTTPMHLLHNNPADPPNEIVAFVPVALCATQRRRVR